jgi:hypothetical protein
MVEAALTASELWLRHRLPERWAPDGTTRRALFRLTGVRDGEHTVAWALLGPSSARAADSIVREVRVAPGAEAQIAASGVETTASLTAAGLVAVHDRTVTPATIEALLGYGPRVPIALRPPTAPLDVEAPVIILTNTAGGHSTEVRWQGDGPEAWRAFTTWIGDLRQTLHELAHGLRSRPAGPNG